MTLYLLFLLFFVMLMSKALDFDLSLAPGLSVKNAMLYIVAGLMLLESAIARNRRIELRQVIIPFGLLFVYALCTWLLIVLAFQLPHYSPLSSLTALKGKLADQILMLLVFYYGVTSLKDSMWLVKSLLWVIVVGNIVTVLDTWNIPDFGIIGARVSGRTEGYLGSTNGFGALLAFFLPATIALYSTERGARRRLAAIGVLATIIALLMTASRGALAGVIVGGALASVYLRRFIPAQRLLQAAIISLTVCVLAIALLLASQFGDLLGTRFAESSTGGVKAISMGRSAIWMRALQEMFAAPWSLLIGFGWEAYYQRPGEIVSTHNTYLGYLYNLGIIGLALWLAAMIGTITAARSALLGASDEVAPYLMAIVFGTAALLVAMMFNDLHQPSLYTWAFTGAALRLGAASTAEAVPNAASSGRRSEATGFKRHAT